MQGKTYEDELKTVMKILAENNAGTLNKEKVDTLIRAVDYGVDTDIIKLYATPDFSEDQIQFLGICARTGLSKEQMEIIAIPTLPPDKLIRLTSAMNKGIEDDKIKYITHLAENNKYTCNEISLFLSKAEELPIDRLMMADRPELDLTRLEIVFDAIAEGATEMQVNILANKNFTTHRMEVIKDAISYGLPNEDIIKLSIGYKTAEETEKMARQMQFEHEKSNLDDDEKMQEHMFDDEQEL